MDTTPTTRRPLSLTGSALLLLGIVLSAKVSRFLLRQTWGHLVAATCVVAVESAADRRRGRS